MTGSPPVQGNSLVATKNLGLSLTELHYRDLWEMKLFSNRWEYLQAARQVLSVTIARINLELISVLHRVRRGKDRS